MKNWKRVLLSMLMLVFFSSNLVYASSIYEMPMENTKHEEHIKEKRNIIKEHKKMNTKLEKQIDKKLKQIEKLFVDLSKSNIAAQEEFEQRLGEKMEVIMDELLSIGEIETSMWDVLKTANRQIKAGKHEAGIKNLDKAIGKLEMKHHKLMELSESLDELITFLKSVQLK